jgi:hypothetical protein
MEQPPQGSERVIRFRFSKTSDVATILDSFEFLRAFVSEHELGGSDVDERSLGLIAGTNVPGMRCGEVIDHKDGQVVLDPILQRG